jgi:Flp pilus assembly protein TadG
MLANHNTVRQGRVRNERGTALAELAIVMPVLLVLILGMLDFGKAFHEWIDQTHVANEGARLAAVNYCPDTTAGDGCGWSTTACPVAARTQCIAWFVANQLDTKELRPPGRAVSAYAPLQNPARACVRYPNGAATQVGDPVEVTVSVRYQWLRYVGGRLALPNGYTNIRGKAVMRLESLPPQPTPVYTDDQYCWPTTVGAGS